MRRITAVAVLLLASAACPACASPGPTVSCCLSVSNTPIHRHRIAGYTVQEAGLCPVRAVVFQTRHGKIVCADPDRKWVRRAIRRMDEEREKAGATAGTY
ncbi:C-C motif chemokine 5-like [Brienomyrus brachyistius]|uniref:C-C motif chemokine 5-like n=1 Tax=Brienomyrus brachyistius TaxID=42636 RepID=UPI0020B33590|nr:C-C motif chemokine 5-like [Brienomyrus brachyistius]